MSYQVLARKWRPRVFKEMVGQEHVLKALINALDNNRLHHAYLFTGTRGVGKTSIARILAKCLNCEVGISSEPCDQCGACTEINQGRFVDLIEVDAASRTKVEDTRELMDNVQYMPTKGRFKVYLIDEVHMLSGHSFNALLKTLEEPPPHVKFLLATTDPHKLPITILSRCLQFNLKNLSPERIEQHLEHILNEESIPFETSALWQLARAADGSMRDALSLTDQAISFGNGQVEDADVSNMLGSIDQRHIVAIVEALITDDAKRMLSCVEAMAEHIPDYSAALADLIVFLHRIAIAQVLPDAIDNTYGDQQEVLTLANKIAAEDVQLFYQAALLGRRDLPLAPDPRTGFEMTLLRMLAFRPAASLETTEVPVRQSNSHHLESTPIREGSAKKFETVAAVISQTEVTAADGDSQFSATAVANPRNPGVENLEVKKESPQKKIETIKSAPSRASDKIDDRQSNASPIVQNPQVEKIKEADEVVENPKKKPAQAISLQNIQPHDWYELVQQINVGGVIQNTALNCQLVESGRGNFSFVLDQGKSTLYDEGHQARLEEVLKQYFNSEVQVNIRVGAVSAETPAQRMARIKHERQTQALKAMQNDPLVQDLIENFSAVLCEDTVAPVDD